MKSNAPGWLIGVVLLLAALSYPHDLQRVNAGPLQPEISAAPATPRPVVTVIVATATPSAKLPPGPTPPPPTPAPTVPPIVLPPRPEGVDPLTGLQVPDKSVLQRRPLLVRVGNDPQIRPQTGLSGADLVYEDIMDGWWVTRLTGVFLSQDMEAVGPVRSARLVNLQMAPLYDGGLVHSGASDPIRWRLSKSDILDLDEFFHRSPYFYKKGADWRGRLFVNLRLLREYIKTKKLEKVVPLRGFVFSPTGSPAASGVPATEFVVPFPKNSLVEFKYNAGTGLYERWVQAKPHLDLATGKQLAASNVIVQFVPHEKTDIVEDSQGTTSINITLLGEGPALIFRDGVAIQARWRTDLAKQTPLFLDAAGQPVPFKPGQTWIELVPPDYVINTTPAGPLGGATQAAAAITDSIPVAASAGVAPTVPAAHGAVTVIPNELP